MVAGKSAASARVYTSQRTPARAIEVASSRTYTFMPPPSPVPGWASGDVCMQSTATVNGDWADHRANCSAVEK